MTWQKLAVSFAIIAILLLGFALFTLTHARTREAETMAAYPPGGLLITVNGRQVQAYVSGAGPDVILIHGASGNALDLTTALAADLSKHYRVTAFDRPGLGWSDTLDDQSLTAQANQLAAAASTLGITNPIIVGQSYGGSVALAWVLHSPLKPAALVLISAPSLPWPGKLDIWYRVANNPISAAIAFPLATAYLPDTTINTAIAHIFAPAPVPENYAKSIAAPLALTRSAFANNAVQVNALRANLVAQEPLYPSLTLPIELIHGTADTIVPLHIHSAPFATNNPNAHLTVIDGGGHMLHYSHTADVLAAIDRAATRAGLR